MSIPELIFVIPYRDREKEKEEFITNMTKRLDGMNYKFIFAHQQDNREFNRGALKNLGFLYAKSLYPNNYENITFVFISKLSLFFKFSLIPHGKELISSSIFQVN